MKRLAKTLKSRYRGIAPMLLPTRTIAIKAYDCVCACDCPNGNTFVSQANSSTEAMMVSSSQGNS